MIHFDKESTIIRGLVLSELNSKFLVFSTLKTKKQTTGDVSSATKKKKKKKIIFDYTILLKRKTFFFFNSPSSPLLSDSAFTSLSLSLSLTDLQSLATTAHPCHHSSSPLLVVSPSPPLTLTSLLLI